jgi:hypothetical protein
VNNRINKAGDRRELFTPFIGGASDDLPIGLSTQDTSSAGSPTLDIVSGSGGLFRLRHDAQNEVQALTLYGGDVLWVDPTKEPVFEVELAVHIGSGSALSADQRVVFGLATARNSTLDDVAKHAWFRVEGANNNIYWETDDATTDDDDNDSGEDYADDVFRVFRIDMSDLEAVKFIIDGNEVANVDLSTLSASDLMQPFIEVQKDAGAEVDGVEIRHLYCGQNV